MVSTQSPDSPLIVIFGATGNQGGSLVKHLLTSSSPYRIRAISRDPSKITTGSLGENENVEIVKADLNNLQDVKDAIEGANIVFVRLTHD
jgi:uncharacterized protein YbjT (DUF2867 family)